MTSDKRSNRAIYGPLPFTLGDTMKQAFYTPKGEHETNTPIIYGKDSTALILHPSRSFVKSKPHFQHVEFKGLNWRQFVKLSIAYDIAKVIKESPRYSVVISSIMAMIPGLIGLIYLSGPCLFFWYIIAEFNAPL